MAGSIEPHVVTPEQLSEAERRMYALARAGTPLAEIGVKLGLTLPEADRRLDALVTRLGLPDRASLRAPLPEPPTATDPPETASNVEPPSLDGDPARRRLSRRTLLAGAGATAGLVAIGGGAVFATRRGGGSSPRESVDATPFTTAPSEATDARSGLQLIEPVDNAFERRRFAPRELVDWDHGIFFMNVDDGSIDALRLASPLAEPQLALIGSYSLPTPRVIEALSQDAKTRILHDRERQASVTYPANLLRLTGGSASRLVFSELDGGEGHRPGFPTGVFRITDYDYVPVDSVAYSLPRFAPDPLVSPDGSRMVLITVMGEQFAIALVDLELGRKLIELAVPLATTATVAIRWHTELTGSADFAVEFRLAAQPGEVPRTLRARLPWSGQWDRPVPEGLDAPRNIMYSPDGGAELRENALRTVPATGLGGGEVWPVVDLFQFGSQTERIRGVSLFYGDGYPNRRFAADGGYFFTKTASTQETGPGWERFRYAAWRRNSTDPREVKLPPSVGSQWYHSILHRGPIPHPTDPTLVAFGRLEAARFYPDAISITGEPIRNIVRANVQRESGPDHLDPWCGNRDELVFALPHGGHDGGWPGALISPAVDLSPPFDDRLAFRVARAGDCVNLRDGPSLSAQVRTCLVDGTELTLWEDAVGAPERGVAFVRNQEGAWCAVRTPDGTTGWVSSAYLDWA